MLFNIFVFNGKRFKEILECLFQFQFHYKVYVKDPQPTSTKKVDTTENALFLMDMLRDMKRKENEEKKVSKIR